MHYTNNKTQFFLLGIMFVAKNQNLSWNYLAFFHGYMSELHWCKHTSLGDKEQQCDDSITLNSVYRLKTWSVVRQAWNCIL